MFYGVWNVGEFPYFFIEKSYNPAPKSRSGVVWLFNPVPRPRTGVVWFFNFQKKTRINLIGGLRRKTPIEINLRDFRRRRQSHKSIIMNAI